MSWLMGSFQSYDYLNVDESFLMGMMNGNVYSTITKSTRVLFLLDHAV